MTEPTSYPIPEDVSGLTPEAAQSQVNKLLADARNPQHPYFDVSSPQHRDYVNHAQKLFRIVADAKAAKQEAADAALLADFKNGTDPYSLKLRAEAQATVKALNALGVEGTCPDRPRPDQTRTLAMQLSLVRQDFSSLLSSLDRELRGLSAPQDVCRKVQDARSTDSADACEALLSDALLWTISEHQNRANKGTTK